MNTIDNLKKIKFHASQFFQTDVYRRIKNSHKLSIEENKISHNHPLKNKTIPETVRQGKNNFRKPSVASIVNMSECLKMFKFIIEQSSNIRQA